MREKYLLILSAVKTFVKRLNVQSAISVVAIAALLITNSYFIVQAQEVTETEVVIEKPAEPEVVSEEPVPAREDTGAANIEAYTQYANLIPHPSCFFKTTWALPNSSVYNPNSEWSTAFVPDGGGAYRSFQDINGDGLADFIYSYNQSNAAGSTLSSEHNGCVYLHTGTGWEKVYECSAYTVVDTQTGNLTQARYSGDCAG